MTKEVYEMLVSVYEHELTERPHGKNGRFMKDLKTLIVKHYRNFSPIKRLGVIDNASISIAASPVKSNNILKLKPEDFGKKSIRGMKSATLVVEEPVPTEKVDKILTFNAEVAKKENRQNMLKGFSEMTDEEVKNHFERLEAINKFNLKEGGIKKMSWKDSIAVFRGVLVKNIEDAGNRNQGQQEESE